VFDLNIDFILSTTYKW